MRAPEKSTSYLARPRTCKRYVRLLAAGSLALCALSGHAAPADSCPAPTAAEPDQWENEHLWQTLAAQGYRIGTVTVLVDDVFELDKPEEDTWYGRTADALHRSTQPSVVRTYLLFQTGEPLKPQLIYESVRRLHALAFLRYASITPISCSAQTVDLEVRVKDAWSFEIDMSFVHSGGQTQHTLSIEDVNFWGTGKTVEIENKVDADRVTNLLSYQDPALFGSRWQFDATYSRLSDGHIEALDFGQPFFEDSTPWSFFIHYVNQQEFLNFYENSNVVWRAQDNHQHFEFDWVRLMDWQDDAGKRIGLSFLRDDYFYGSPQSFPPVSIPQPVLTPRQFAGAAVTFEYYQDRYASFVNMALIDRAEDYNLGWDTHLEGGYFAKAFNSPMTAWFYDVASTYGVGIPDDTLLLGSSEIQGRRQGGVQHNVLGNLTLTLYNQSFPSQTLVAHMDLDYTLRPDPENLVYLGGSQGMLGYPNFLYLGDRRWQMHLEDRHLTQMRLWNTLQVGFAAYTEVGKIRQFGSGHWSPTLADVGLALRLGDVRSAFGGVIYVSLAWPLTKIPGISERQFLIGNSFNF
jgi:hypothetical protein